MFTREEWNQIVGAKGKWVSLERAMAIEAMVRGYGPSNRTCSNHYLVRHLGKNLIQLQAWSTYAPAPGSTLRWGRRSSRLLDETTAVVYRRPPHNEQRYVYNRGDCEKYLAPESFVMTDIGPHRAWFWNGKLSSLHETKLVKLGTGGDNSQVQDTFHVKWNKDGHLCVYNRHMPDGTTRRVEIVWDAGNNNKPTIRRWRGKFSEKQTSWNSKRDVTYRRTEDGSPLKTEGDFIEWDINDGKKVRECRFVAGRKHGIEHFYNSCGREIDTKFFHHATEIPRWIFEKPQDASVEEIIGETNAEVRRAMLELQGFDIFLERARAKGLVSVLDEDPSPMTGTLLKITLVPDGNSREVDNNEVCLLRVKDGTLDKHYCLRVPPTMKTARQANAWTWGINNPMDYAPIVQR